MKYLIIIMLFVLISCSLQQQIALQDEQEVGTSVIYIDESITRVPLEQRGWSKDKRKFYMDAQKAKFQDYIVELFIEQRITPGFPKYLVEYMYGYPNKTMGDTIWAYIDSSYVTLLELKFNADGVVYDYTMP